MITAQNAYWLPDFRGDCNDGSDSHVDTPSQFIAGRTGSQQFGVDLFSLDVTKLILFISIILLYEGSTHVLDVLNFCETMWLEHPFNYWMLLNEWTVNKDVLIKYNTPRTVDIITS